MASSSDNESRKVRPHKRSSRRGKKTRSKTRRHSSSDSSTSSHSSSSSYKRAKKKSKRKKRKGERKRVQYERERRHTRDVERDDSSSSDERRREGKKSRRSKKRRKHDYHTEAKANDMSTKAQNETIGGIPSADKRDGMVGDVTAATANTSETNKSNHSSNSASTANPTKSKGPMTQQQYLELQSQIREVVDPHTGRTRWMRGTGEIVERIVSREEHSRLNQSATLGDGRGFARDIARVAAMNRNGS